jgi:hypothetical protein
MIRECGMTKKLLEYNFFHGWMAGGVVGEGQSVQRLALLAGGRAWIKL